MFGKNNVTSPFRDPEGSLKINDLFFTIQGEGPDAGRPAIFLRLSHCNLRCFFCDTEFEAGVVMTREALALDIMKLSKRHGCTLVVITGGEPLLQNFVPLVESLNASGISVSVETAGIGYYPELAKYFSPVREFAGNLIVCSPKTGKIVADLESIVGAWKYIVRVGETDAHGLPNRSTQLESFPMVIFKPSTSAVPIYIQAMDEQDPVKNERNLKHAAEIVMQHGYRLSVQMHKLADLK